MYNFLKKLKSSDFNEYFDGKWQIRGRRPSRPGEALLQKRIKLQIQYRYGNLEQNTPKNQR